MPTPQTRNLTQLAAEIRTCRLCVEQPRKGAPPLPHAPNPIFQIGPAARLCIASQAAGTRAHASSTPFMDPSGVRLREWLGVTEDEFYDPARVAIVPMGFCFPGQDAKGGDLPPRKECAPVWRQRVFDALPQLELILLVGRYAQTWHLGKRAAPTLTETVARWRDYGPHYLPLPHPSWRNNVWLKQNPWFAEEVLPELQQRVRALMKEPVGAKRATRT